MPKDFDNWNSQKKHISESCITKFYRAREIWWCSLGLNVGFEQDGKGVEYERPILVLRAFNRYVCLVVPLTTSQKKNPYHVSAGIVNSKPSFAIISQLRLVDTKRFINRIEVLNEEIFQEIKNAVKGLL